MIPSSGNSDHQVVIEIGGIPIALQTSDPEFVSILRDRYGDYMHSGVSSDFTFQVELIPPGTFNPDADAEVWLEDGEWRLERGDFRATWNPESRQGLIRQSANPYSIDSVLRITHTLLLARTGGFLLHASSAVRNGKAFLFSGLSEAGKTTIARLAPPDVALLTDEASYVRRVDDQYLAYGTPFAGELGTPGKNISAPIAALYFLAKAQQNQNRENGAGRGYPAAHAEYPLFCARPKAGAHGFRIGLRVCGGSAGLSAFVFSGRACLGPDWVRYGSNRKIFSQEYRHRGTHAGR